MGMPLYNHLSYLARAQCIILTLSILGKIIVLIYHLDQWALFIFYILNNLWIIYRSKNKGMVKSNFLRKFNKNLSSESSNFYTKCPGFKIYIHEMETDFWMHPTTHQLSCMNLEHTHPVNTDSRFQIHLQYL